MLKTFFLLILAIGWCSIIFAQDKPQTFNAQGISIEFTATRATKAVKQVVAGEEATVRFKITGNNGAVPLTNLRPVAWLDQRQAKEPPSPRECREKVQSFLQPSFSKRPTIDLNAYLILALNNEPNISVIDPLSGFGGSKLYTLIPLKSSGDDWVFTSDNKRLYVSMPQVNQVAVIDIPTWKVIANIDAGNAPTRVALQHDARYLWVGNDSGVTVIDTSTNKVAAQLTTAAGPHDIAFSDDDRLAFLTNTDAGTLSVIDIRKLALSKEIKVGSNPSAITFSSLSQTAYVANEGDGTIVAIGGQESDIVARIQTERGVRVIGVPTSGHYGFALNPQQSKVYVFDLSSNRLIQTVPVGPGSDQISFTQQFAYIRSTGSEFVTMIRLSDIGKEAAVTKFPAGQRAPAESPSRSHAAAIVPAPEDGAVLVANPADKMIYYYTEGMAAPMGSFQNYKRDPRALLVMDNSLRETERGVYSTTVRFNTPGQYDVAFLLDSPRLINCFEITVAENPNAPRKIETAIKIEPLVKEAVANAGARFNVRFKVIDSKTGKVKTDLNDLRVLVFLAPGIWQQRDLAKPIGEGVYETSFVPPSAGVYYVFFQSASLGLQFNQSTPLTIQAVKN
ncbi:MAG TPA: YncE family protein [Pyrinomonadaceae bacterium]|nr:YncE family protein [Pyrinomonadaceae bacterium]